MHKLKTLESSPLNVFLVISDLIFYIDINNAGSFSSLSPDIKLWFLFSVAEDDDSSEDSDASEDNEEPENTEINESTLSQHQDEDEDQ